MYNADQTLIDRLDSNIQTAANNNDPRPLVYITRNKTAITSQRYWERVMLTTDVGTRSSVAIRRPEGSLLADMIFVAQVVGGNAVIQYAQPRSNLADMTWETLTTIPNVSELSIMFDGYMEIDIDRVEAYTIGDVPYVFFVDSSGSLKARNLDSNTADVTISDNAVNVASVRGLYSEAAGLDDGIWVFYTNASGQLWEARMLNGEVDELTQITMKPEGVTAWEDVWAGLTFDYRIVLQLKGNDGKVYTLLSSSRPYGFSSLEYVGISKIALTGKFGEIPPEPLSAENIHAQGSWSKCVKIIFDRKVYGVSFNLKDSFRILDAYGTQTYAIDVTHGATDKEIYIWFSDFYRCVQDLRIEHLGGTNFGGVDFPMDQFTLPINLKNVNPSDGREHISLSIEITGTFTELLDGKAYTNDAVQITDLTIAGQFSEVEFKEGYVTDALGITEIVLAGQFKHVDEGGT